MQLYYFTGAFNLKVPSGKPRDQLSSAIGMISSPKF